MDKWIGKTTWRPRKDRQLQRAKEDVKRGLKETSAETKVTAGEEDSMQAGGWGWGLNRVVKETLLRRRRLSKDLKEVFALIKTISSKAGFLFLSHMRTQRA